MKIVCSWCNLQMGEKKPFENNEISHGMCLSCMAEMKEEMMALEKSGLMKTALKNPSNAGSRPSSLLGSRFSLSEQ